MSKLDKDQVIENFTNAYTAANGKKPNIEAGGGWYSVDGNKKVRLAALEEMTTELSSKSAPVEKKAAKPAAEKKAAKPAAEKKAAKPAAEKKATKPAAEKKAAKPAAEKKAAKPAAEKKPAKKKATKKKAAKKPSAKSNKSESDFSVKAFWAEKIIDQNPGSKLPR